MPFSRIPGLITLLAFMAVYSSAQTVVGEMFASDASVHGSVLFAGGGTQIQSGSSLTSGDAAAVVKLRRGGEVRVCPRTSISVSASPNGRDLLWGMNEGAIEASFKLSASADVVMTPDFRILLSGPGIFHFAISADSKGNTCVRSLPQNTASLIVTELNGDGTYQVKPNVEVLFRNGKVSDLTPLVPPDCGCPPSQPSVLTADSKPQSAPALERTAGPGPGTPAAVPELPPATPDPDLPARSIPADLAHLEVEAPFVYKAGNPDEELTYAAARLRLTSGTELPSAMVLPPAMSKLARTQSDQRGLSDSIKSSQKKGFLGKIGSFFARIFR